MHQAGNEAKDRTAGDRKAELLADVIGIGPLAFPIAGSEGVGKLRTRARIPALVDAVQDACQLRGVGANRSSPSSPQPNSVVVISRA